MKDVKFVLGACSKNSSKFYFQYNNRVYFIIEKKAEEEKVVERITNIRYAYEKWRTIKADSDDRGKNGITTVNQTGDGQVEHLSDIIDYNPTEFEYEAAEKVRMDEVRAERKKMIKKPDTDKRPREDKKRTDKKFDKKPDRKLDKKPEKKYDKKYDKKNEWKNEYNDQPKKNVRKNVRFDKNSTYKKNERVNHREAE